MHVIQNIDLRHWLVFKEMNHKKRIGKQKNQANFIKIVGNTVSNSQFKKFRTYRSCLWVNLYQKIRYTTVREFKLNFNNTLSRTGFLELNNMTFSFLWTFVTYFIYFDGSTDYLNKERIRHRQDFAVPLTILNNCLTSLLFWGTTSLNQHYSLKSFTIPIYLGKRENYLIAIWKRTAEHSIA